MTEKLPQYGDYYYYDYSNIGYSDSGMGIHEAEMLSGLFYTVFGLFKLAKMSNIGQ